MSTTTPTASYQWLPVSPEKDSFLKPVTKILKENVEYFCMSSDRKVSRLAADGIWMLKGRYMGVPIAVCWCDFRVKGASFSSVNTSRLSAFLSQITELDLPLVFSFESLGFRFMEGRSIFNQVFSLVPSLERFRQKNLLITICKGQCLGIGAILFGLGHYRLAASPDSLVNLTGPKVFQQFFGKKVNFPDIAGAQVLLGKTGLIHEICSTIDEAFSYAINLGTSLHHKLSLPELAKLKPKKCTGFLEKNRYKADLSSFHCLQHISRKGIELFKGYDDKLKAFILEFRGQHLAVLLNPPDQTNNMFSYRALEVYQHALNIFGALKLPLVVLLDTPGIDPRFDGSNQGTIEKLISLTYDILNYSMPTVGVVNGRGYGGANTLAIPRCYGSVATYGIKGRIHVDVMHESIMRELLSGSRDLLDSWERIREHQNADENDIVNVGLVDEIITYQDLSERLWQDLFAKRQTPESTDAAQLEFRAFEST